MNSIDKILDQEFSDVAPRILAVITGAILIKFGFVVSHLIPPFTNPVSIIAMFLLYGSAFTLIGIGLTDLDISRWGNHIAYGVFGVLVVTAGVAYFTKASSNPLGTDGILFSQYSVDLLLSGQNPYSHVMDPAFDKYSVADEFVTYKRDGTTVMSLSYPALSFLWFVPQILLGIPNINLTAVVVFLLVLLFLIRESPDRLALAPIAVMFTDPSIITFSYGGVFDILWVLPLLIGMKFWAAKRYQAACFVLGLAFATKQTPWFIAPFLGIWLYNESETIEEAARSIATCMAAGIAGFVLPNLPFIIWNASAWFEGVFTPISGGGVGLVKQGSGLTLLTVAGVQSLPKSFYTIAVLASLVTLMGIYALYFERTKWVIWVLPAVILWFNYRSLQNYFVFFIPVAYYGIFLKLKTDAQSSQVDSLSKNLDSGLWKPHIDIPNASRRIALVGILVCFVASLGGAAAMLEDDGQLDATIEIVGTNDTSNIHRVDELSIQVTNKESFAITPEFHIMHSEHTIHPYWERVSGPDRLAPGETATYTIRPESAEFAIPYQADAAIAMSDSGTERDARLPITSFQDKSIEHALNPSFNYWSFGQFENTKAPFRWHPVSHTEGNETTTIQEGENGSAHFAVSNVTRPSGNWGMIGLAQGVPLPSEVYVEATPETVAESATTHPKTATGVEIAENNHRVWVVFADVDERKVITRNGELSYVIVYIPATPGERVTATVDVKDIYDTQGWKTPPKRSITFDGADYEQRRANLLAFAAAYPNSDGNAAVTFHQIETNSSEFDKADDDVKHTKEMT